MNSQKVKAHMICNGGKFTRPGGDNEPDDQECDSHLGSGFNCVLLLVIYFKTFSGNAFEATLGYA